MIRDRGTPEAAVARRMKDYQERRRELLDAAWELFSTGGYEGTTVNAIIDRLGVSKGTFYHYFLSKEDVLDAVVERLTREIMEEIGKALAAGPSTAMERLNCFLATSRRWKLAHVGLMRGIMEVIYRDENVIILHKMNRRIVDRVAPELAAIVAQGVREGVFDTPDPGATAELILHFTNTFGETTARQLLEAGGDADKLALVGRRVEMVFDAIERMLGAPKGSLERVDGDAIAAFANPAEGSTEEMR